MGWIVGQILEIRDETGQLSRDASLAKLRSDPFLQGLIFDLQFPANPFAESWVSPWACRHDNVFDRRAIRVR